MSLGQALIVGRFTLQEAVSRRLVLAGVVLSLAFLGLFALAFYFMYGMVVEAAADPRNRTAPVVAATLLTVLGLYAVNFMASFLGLFLSVGSISSEVDGGTLHAILARPLRRGEFVLGRWLAYAFLAAVYVALMVGLVLGIAWQMAGYEAADPARALGLMVLSAVLLVTLSLFGSACLSTLANGVVCFSLFGLGWLAGVVEFVGGTLGNVSMVDVGIAVSLLIPSDALWRGASYYLQTPIVTALLPAGREWLPFASMTPPAVPFVIWSALYPIVFLIAAVRVFAGRDL